MGGGAWIEFIRANEKPWLQGLKPFSVADAGGGAEARPFRVNRMRFGVCIGAVRGHCERHPYVTTGASERAAARGHWLVLVLCLRLRAVFGRI